MTLKMLANSLAQNRTFYHFNPLFYKVLGKKIMAKTVEQLKAEFATEGKTFVSWANE